jgi:exopolysaccharide biosynthesis predicted pyruvyltransferase EpsI
VSDAAVFPAEENALGTLLRAHADRHWLFVRPGGNWGDHLIYAGAEQLARTIGVRWTDCDHQSFERTSSGAGDCIYLHGGGGYNSWGSGRPFRLLANAVARPAALVIQGPQTVESASGQLAGRFAEALADVRAQCVVFMARERHSFEEMRRLAPAQLEIRLDHDTAFQLQADDLLRLASLARMPEGRYHLTVMREDDERPAESRGMLARGVILDPAYMAESFEHWLRIHLFARSVLSNRLHSAIVGALAGKPVTLAFGSYHKNRSIWEHSLSGRGVEWTDGIRTAQRRRLPLPARLRDSYKIAKLRLLMQRVPVR